MIKDKFIALHKIETECVSFPSAGEALNQIALSGDKTNADVLIGVDNSLLARANKLGVFAKNSVKIPESVPKALRFDAEDRFVPFDYGYLAFIYNADKSKGKLPTSLTELSEMPAFAKKIVIEDPRTSSIGLSFLVWSHLAFGAKTLDDFWGKLAKQLITIAPGWSGAYGLFSSGGADLVLSYTTSPAYHMEVEKKFNFKAIPFSEGHYRQIEGMAVLSSSNNPQGAKKWIEYLLSDEVQSQIGAGNWMYPVSQTAKVPPSFSKLIEVKKIIEAGPKLIEASKETWIHDWTRFVAQIK